MNRWFFVFLGFIFFKLRRVQDAKMKLRVKPCGRRSRVACADPCHWSEGCPNNVGVSLQESRATRQVMLGVSLRPRWDATLVHTMRKRQHVTNRRYRLLCWYADCTVVVPLLLPIVLGMRLLLLYRDVGFGMLRQLYKTSVDFHTDLFMAWMSTFYQFERKYSK